MNMIPYRDINDGLDFHIRYDHLEDMTGNHKLLGADNLIPREYGVMESQDGYFVAQRDGKSLWLGKGTENLYGIAGAQGVHINDFNVEEFDGYTRITRVAYTGEDCNMFCIEDKNIGNGGALPPSLENNTTYSYKIKIKTSPTITGTPRITRINSSWSQMDKQIITSGEVIYTGTFMSGTDDKYLGIRCYDMAVGEWLDVYHDITLEKSSYPTPTVQNSRPTARLIYDGFTDWRNKTFALWGKCVHNVGGDFALTNNISGWASNKHGIYASKPSDKVGQNYIVIITTSSNGTVYTGIHFEDNTVATASMEDFNNIGDGVLNFTYDVVDNRITSFKECKVWNRAISADEINQLKSEFYDTTPKPYIDIDFTKGISDPKNEVYPLGYDNLVPRKDGIIESQDGNLIGQRTEDGLWIGKGTENIYAGLGGAYLENLNNLNNYNSGTIKADDSRITINIIENLAIDTTYHFKVKIKISDGQTFNRYWDGNQWNYLTEDEVNYVGDGVYEYDFSFTTESAINIGTFHLQTNVDMVLGTLVEVWDGFTEISSFATPYVKNSRNDGKFIIPNKINVKNKTWFIEAKGNGIQIPYVGWNGDEPDNNYQLISVKSVIDTVRTRVVVSTSDTGFVFKKWVDANGATGAPFVHRFNSLQGSLSLMDSGSSAYRCAEIYKFKEYDERLTTEQCETLLEKGTLETISDSTLEDACTFYIADGCVTDFVNGITPDGYVGLIPKWDGYIDNEGFTCNFQVVRDMVTGRKSLWLGKSTENLSTKANMDESGIADSSWKNIGVASVDLANGETLTWTYDHNILDQSGCNISLIQIKTEDNTYHTEKYTYLENPSDVLQYTNTSGMTLTMVCKVYLCDGTPTGGNYHITGTNMIEKSSFLTPFVSKERRSFSRLKYYLSGQAKSLTVTFKDIQSKQTLLYASTNPLDGNNRVYARAAIEEGSILVFSIVGGVSNFIEVPCDWTATNCLTAVTTASGVKWYLNKKLVTTTPAIDFEIGTAMFTNDDPTYMSALTLLNASMLDKEMTADEVAELHEREGYLNIPSRGEVMPVPHSVPSRDEHGCLRDYFVVDNVNDFAVPILDGHMAYAEMASGRKFIVDFDTLTYRYTGTDDITYGIESTYTAEYIQGNYIKITTNAENIPYTVKYFKKS